MRSLFRLLRAGLPEVDVHGAFAWATPSRALGGSDADEVVYARSTIKPLAAKATWAGLEGLPSEAVALACASHDGEGLHVRSARALAGGAAPHLATPPSLPLGPARYRLTRPDRWRHPCSGEHAGVLRACTRLGWDPTTYLHADHPRHAAVRAWQRSVLGPHWGPRGSAVDGCGLPTDALSLGELARLYAALAATPEADGVWSAMTRHPVLVGGEGRLDTALLRAGGGRLLAKEGADGLLACAIQHPDHPEGLGLVIKIAHGWDPVAAGRVAAVLLGGLGFPVPVPAVPRGQVLVFGAGLAP